MQENNNAVDLNNEHGASDKHTVVGIRFRSCGKVYTFDAGDLALLPGAKVVVESEMGLSVGTVATPKYAREKQEGTLKKVLRIASEADFNTIKENRVFQDEARAFCVSRVRELNLPMKIVTTETTLDRKRLVFYFTSDGRIDFRELVRDLASKFKTRIEMRQIGVRDEVKLLGGLGICGRQTCCSLFLTNFEPVTIKMAKQQELSINQSKLSGVCGRLMCCLRYECKDSAEEKETAALQKGLTTAPSGTSEAAPLQADADTAAPGKPRPQIEQPSAPAAAGRETGPGRRSRRPHRGHKRHAQGKPASDAPPQEGQAKTTDEARGEEKGKVFNRRRRFWKKKKH